LLSFQWDQPWFSVNGKGSASDVDIYFVDDDGNPITLCDDDANALVCRFPGVDENEGGDAVEVPALINDSEEDVHANIATELFSGPAPADSDSAFEGTRFPFGFRLRGCSDGAALDGRILTASPPGKAGNGVRNEPHPEPRAHVTTGRGARDIATRGAVRRQNAYRRRVQETGPGP
jgi:hypothetical protein